MSKSREKKCIGRGLTAAYRRTIRIALHCTEGHFAPNVPEFSLEFFFPFKNVIECEWTGRCRERRANVTLNTYIQDRKDHSDTHTIPNVTLVSNGTSCAITIPYRAVFPLSITYTITIPKFHDSIVEQCAPLVRDLDHSRLPH